MTPHLRPRSLAWVPLLFSLGSGLTAVGAAELSGGGFLTATGHTAAACILRGRAAERGGDRIEAARYYRLATFLAPDLPAPRARLAAFKQRPHAPPSDLLTRIGPVGPAARRALSLSWMGESRQGLGALGAATGPVAEAVRAQLLADLGDFDGARRRLDGLARVPEAGALVAFLRATVAQWDGDSAAEGRLLEQARQLAPESPEVLGSLAAREVGAGNLGAGEHFLEFEAGLPETSDPWRLATRAAILAALGQTEGAAAALAALKREHLMSPQTWITEAGLRLRQGRVEAAKAALGSMVEATHGSVVLVPAANLLASIGRQDLAREALRRLEPRVSSQPRVQQLFRMLSALPDPEDSKRGTDGPFRYVTRKDTPELAVRGALRLFGRARRIVDQRLGHPGPNPVELVVVYTPGERPWGYYDAVNRRIVVRGDTRLAAKTKRIDPAIAHVARHEYGHMAFDARLRRAGEGIVPYPRWMMEGIADHLAGGIEYLEAMGYRLRDLSDRPLDAGELTRILSSPVLGFGKIAQQDQAQAYAQSYSMVAALLELFGTQDPWGKLAGFIRRLGLGRDLAQALEADFGVEVEELMARYVGDVKARRSRRR